MTAPPTRRRPGDHSGAPSLQQTDRQPQDSGEGCVPCSHAARHGWTGPDHRGAHCRDCHRSWTGLTECHCARCHEHFGSVKVFDLHLPHCDPVDAAERLRVLARNDGNPVFATRDRASGPVWVQWRSHQHPWGEK